MKIKEKDHNIFVIEFDKNRRIGDLKEIYECIGELSKEIGLGTYGGVNTDVLYREIAKVGYNIEREEICASDDDDIGLRMPNFWPINFGKHALSTAMYYVKEQMRYTSGFESFPSWNREARKQLGWISLIEIYDINDVLTDLNERRISYFSTPRTLMECVRFLEDWGMDRLGEYRDYSEEIEKWSKKQGFYDRSEWHLGREQSKSLMKQEKRRTNVRLCVNEYWKQVLCDRGFNPNDRELDILSPEYEQQRDPKIVLVGEDFFPLDGRFTSNKSDETITFKYNFRDIQHVIPVNTSDPKNTSIANAELLREKYPQAKIGLMTYGNKSGKLFKLIKEDGVKEGPSEEVVYSLMAVLGLNNNINLMGELEKCLK